MFFFFFFFFDKILNSSKVRALSSIVHITLDSDDEFMVSLNSVEIEQQRHSQVLDDFI